MYREDIRTELDGSAGGSASTAVATPSVESEEPIAPFLAELARAMREAADVERARIIAEVSEDTKAQEDKLRNQSAGEAVALRQLAAEDVARIEEEAAAAIERIRHATAEQVARRRERLEDHLVRHAAMVDDEIQRVHDAVDGYQAELVAFFERLQAERDPAEILRQANLLPPVPDLDAVGAAARASAIAEVARETRDAEAGDVEAVGPSSGEPPAAGEAAGTAAPADAVSADDSLVGVMDPDARGRPAPDVIPPVNGGGSNGTAPASNGAAPEPVAVGAGTVVVAPSANGATPAVGDPAAVASFTGGPVSRLLRGLAPWLSSTSQPRSEHTD